MNEQLEQRVRERTAELAAANEDLRGEIEERSRTEVALRASEATFAAVFKSAPVLLLLDENRNVPAANPAATSVLANCRRGAKATENGGSVWSSPRTAGGVRDASPWQMSVRSGRGNGRDRLRG